VLGRGPCWGGGRVGEGAVLGRGPCWGGGRVGEGAVLGRGPCWGGGHVGEGAVLGRGPCWGGGRVGQRRVGEGPRRPGDGDGPPPQPRPLQTPQAAARRGRVDGTAGAGAGGDAELAAGRRAGPQRAAAPAPAHTGGCAAPRGSRAASVSRRTPLRERRGRRAARRQPAVPWDRRGAEASEAPRRPARASSGPPAMSARSPRPGGWHGCLSKPHPRPLGAALPPGRVARAQLGAGREGARSRRQACGRRPSLCNARARQQRPTLGTRRPPPHPRARRHAPTNRSRTTSFAC
jgi:hypothetical protein